MKSVVIIPARNERDVSAVVDRIPRGFDVLLLDGGDNGTIGAGSRRLVEIIPAPAGNGMAVRTGLTEALRRGYEFIFRVDGDGQYLPEMLPQMRDRLLEGSSFVTCSRYHPDSGGDSPPIDRLLFHRTIGPLVCGVTGYELTDVISGCWGFRANWIADVLPTLTTEGYGLTIELILRRAARGEPSPVELVHPRLYSGNRKCVDLYTADMLELRMRRVNEYFLLLARLFQELGFDQSLIAGRAQPMSVRAVS